MCTGRQQRNFLPNLVTVMKYINVLVRNIVEYLKEKKTFIGLHDPSCWRTFILTAGIRPLSLFIRNVLRYRDTFQPGIIFLFIILAHREIYFVSFIVLFQKVSFHQVGAVESELESEPQLFCLSGTGMHSGSVFGSGSDIKRIFKQSKKSKIKNEMTTFWETLLLPTLKRQDFVQFVFLTV
jgi:hypothetical protein